MIFDPDIQYRAAIMRGKSLTQMDDLLPLYANIINDVCPISIEEFRTSFNLALSKKLHSETEKALNNHRTEIAGKLFGMYWVDEQNIVNAAPRTLKLIEDGDQPAFFKDFCCKIQFPSPAQKSQTYISQIQEGISIHPCQFSLAVMLEIEKKKTFITKDELAYYVLNCKQVLQGIIFPKQVVETILSFRAQRINKTIQTISNHSFTWQHINELIDYMVIANLVEKDTSTSKLRINKREMRSILALVGGHEIGKLNFEITTYDYLSVEGRKKLSLDWDFYYAQPSIEDISILNTDIRALVPNEELVLTDQEINALEKADETEAWGIGSSNNELGNQGEEFVFKLEKNRVLKMFPRLEKHVINMAATRGIGYDIQSVLADGEVPEEKIFIEVKSTRRYSPVSNLETLNDAITITRNEWVAAKQYKESYRIFRVYFSKSKVQIFEIKDVINLSLDPQKVKISPLTYRVDFSGSSGNFIYDA